MLGDTGNEYIINGDENDFSTDGTEIVFKLAQYRKSFVLKSRARSYQKASIGK